MYTRRRSMIKYPLYVTLDTNIFDANKLDFSQDSTLGLLVNHVKAGKIKIVLSNIVLKEVEKHVIKASDGVCSSFRGLRKELINVVSDKFLEEIGIETDLLMLNKEEYRTKSLKMWKKFLEKLNPEILNLSLVDLDGIVSDYFAINPPFESSEKKRKEFPDAFIANQIRKRFGEDEVIAIISDDKGFKKACGYSENHIFYQSLGELYNAINRQEREYKEIVRITNSLIGRYISEIEEEIKNEDCVEVHGLSCDSDGIESGYDYSDAEVVSIRGIQLIMTLVQSEDIIVRERYDEDLIRGQQFVLSFAAVIMLYMIGVKPEFLKERQVFVPESMRNTILTMCTDIINENDKEHVSSLGVREKRLYMNVVSESEKVQILGEAAALKNFVSQLNTWSNNREFCDVQDEERDWLDVFGISDYDALALAQGKKAVIVTGEVTIQSLIQEIKLNISGTGILNFLVALKMDVYVLLDCIEQMIKYRFEITMTEKGLRYIIDEYSKLENQELKEDFMCKWIDCLTLVESMGDEYKEVYAQNMMRVCQDIIREEYEVLNPVWRNYFSLCVKYKCRLETK